MFFKTNYEAKKLYNDALNYDSNHELHKRYIEKSAKLGYVPSQLRMGYFDNLLLSSVDFSIRSKNAFKSNNITYLSDLIKFSESDVLRMPNLGRKTFNEIKSFLEFKGLNFGFKLPETISKTNNLDSSDILYINLPKKIEIIDQKLSNVKWSVRTSNCLKKNGIDLLSQLIRYTESDFLRLPNFGRKSLNEIEQFLKLHDLYFGIYNNPNLRIVFQEPKKIEIQDQKLSNILWSVRTSNCLEENGIDLLSQLIRYSKSDLLRLPNFGRKSLNEIEQFLKLHDLYFSFYDNENIQVKFLEPKSNDKIDETIQYDRLNIIEEFKKRVETLIDRQKDVIKKRLGIDCKEHTLEEIGEIYNVSRERIRQIEKQAKKILEHPSKNWYQNLWHNTLNHLIEISDKPISINNLDKNHQFSGIKNNQTLFQYLLSTLEPKYFIHDTLGYNFISKANKTDIINLEEKTKNILKESVGKTINLIEEACKSIFSNFPELRKHFIRFLLQNSTTSNDENEDEYLTAYSERMTALTIIKSIFYKSNKILANKEIEYIINSEYPEIDYRNVKNRIIDLKDVYPMSHGTWGKIENLNIDKLTLDKIVDEIPDLINNLNKQEFNSIEIYENIKDRYKFINNEFEISAILREFNLAKYLGRNSFAILGSSLTKRTELNDIIISILEEFKRPLTQKELVSEIKKIKGFSNLLQFQIRRPVKLLRSRHYALDYWDNEIIENIERHQNSFKF